MGQAPITVPIPTLPSLTAGLRLHQPGFLFPAPGAQHIYLFILVKNGLYS